MTTDVQLPRGIRPRHYQIDFEVDPEPGTFGGACAIEVGLSAQTQTVEFHAVELTIGEATVEQNGKRIAALVELLPTQERVRLSLETPLTEGTATVRLRFGGTLQRGLRGLYRVEKEGQVYAFTQFEPADARRAFPCFDEPACKATFAISAKVPGGLTAIGNGEVIEERELPGGARLFRFATTPKLSTYLVALAVGKFAALSCRSGNTEVRVLAVPGKERLGAAALEMGAAFLPILADYFGIPYPYSKLDLLAVPDFEAGAMENAGAIFFRESLLLLDPERATLDATRGVAITVAHEMAHQWFGNLVTMEWWDDLWLNEAFATWMEFKVVDAWKPEWQIWTDFERMKAAPLYLDSLQATRPIQAEVASPEQANEMFDAITYNKGAAVLRMFEVFMGETAFRNGVSNYLKAHSGGNARAAALWAALEKSSSQPIGELAKSWFTRPGYPLLSLSQQDGKLRYQQRRFYAKADSAAGGVPGSKEEPWKIPLTLKLSNAAGETTRQASLLAAESGEVALATRASWLLGNAEGSGFYRVAYEPSALAALAKQRSALSPVERVALLGDQWAQVRAGVSPLAPQLALLDGFGSDTQRTVVETVVGQLGYLEDFVLASADRPVFQRWVQRVLDPHLQRLGWEPRPNEAPDEKLLRPRVLEALGRVGGSAGVIAEAKRRSAAHLAGQAQLDSSLLGVALRLAAADGDPALHQDFRKRMLAAQVPEAHDRFMVALAAFEAPGVVAHTLALALSPDIRSQDLQTLLGVLFGNRAARRATWTFVKEHFNEIRAKAPVFGLRRVVSATASLCEPDLRSDVASFFAAPEHHVEAGERELKQALEAIDLGLAFRTREQANLGRFVASGATAT